MGFTNTVMAKYGTIVPLEEIRANTRFTKRHEKISTKVVLRSYITHSMKELALQIYVCHIRNRYEHIRYFGVAGGPVESTVLFLTETVRTLPNNEKEVVYKVRIMIENLYPEFIHYYL